MLFPAHSPTSGAASPAYLTGQPLAQKYLPQCGESRGFRGKGGFRTEHLKAPDFNCGREISLQLCYKRAGDLITVGSEATNL